MLETVQGLRQNSTLITKPQVHKLTLSLHFTTSSLLPLTLCSSLSQFILSSFFFFLNKIKQTNGRGTFITDFGAVNEDRCSTGTCFSTICNDPINLT